MLSLRDSITSVHQRVGHVGNFFLIEKQYMSGEIGN